MEISIKTKKRPKALRIVFWVFTGVIGAAFFSAIFAVVVRFLWNWLMPVIFGLPVISYLQAFGLVILTRLLVGGWHKGHGDHDHKDHMHHFFSKKRSHASSDSGDFSKDAFRDYWEKEGKDAFKSHIGKKFGEENAESKK